MKGGERVCVRRVRLCRRGAPEGAPEGATLRLRGLPYSATEADIAEFFKGALGPLYLG